MAVFSIRLEQKMDRTLQRLAKDTERPKSYFIKKALELYLDESPWRAELIRMMRR